VTVVACDLVVTNGAVFTPGRTLARQTTVAVGAGRILAVGGDDVRDLAGPATDIVDAGGGLVVAGFQDAHVHPLQGGLGRRTCDLSELDTASDYLAAIAAYAADRPSLDWITGQGWAMAAFPNGLPRREQLDAVVPDRPAFFGNRDGHGAWANSRALELAGIDARTPDPRDGRIERDADGTPTGALHEGAMDLLVALQPATTFEDEVSALLEAQAYLHSLGITAWQDAIVGSYTHLADSTRAYQQCATSGRLTAKVVGALWWDRGRGDEQIPELLERRAQYTTGHFAPTSVKIMQDGVAENFTAAMTSPYLDAHGHAGSNSGLSMVDPVALRDYVTQLDGHGFQVHVHAIGDRAVREALDAFEAALTANGRNDNRHHIAHIQVVHPEDIARFAELRVAANMQPLWAAHEPQMDELTIPFLGPERATWQYPFASLVANGATLVAGSDWPVSSPDPLAGIHVAVNRSAPPPAGHAADTQGQEPFLPEQALDVPTALTAYTAGSAWVNHLDDTGRLVPGAAADLVVLDRDIVTGPREEIADAVVVATFVDGVAVYRR
jgi:predicted amidohydrolase YtcJ